MSLIGPAWVLFLKFSYLFIFGCNGSSELCLDFSLVAMSEGYSSLWFKGFSSWWLLLLKSTDSRVWGFNSDGAEAQLPPGMWNLPRAGIKPMSPALAGGCLTTGPPVKSPAWVLCPVLGPGPGSPTEAHQQRGSKSAPLRKAERLLQKDEMQGRKNLG